MGNLYKEKLEGNNIAVVFGTFAPFHIGHMDLVAKASAKHDAVVLIVSGYDDDRGETHERPMPLKKRFRYLREVYAHDSMVYVTYIDETNMPKMPHGWNEWTQSMIDLSRSSLKNKNAKITFYVGEEDYVTELDKRANILGDYAVELISRDHLTISATKIRNNPIAHWNKIAIPFRRVFNKNILITGPASGGKTTLGIKLSMIFGFLFSPEFAREYQEVYNVNDLETETDDFLDLIRGQFKQTADLINSGNTNGGVIADTDAITTMGYSDPELNLMEPGQVSLIDHEKLMSAYEETIRKSHWDLILIVPPVTDYKDDNFRDMRGADEDYRWNFYNKMIENYEKYGYGDVIHILDAPATEEDTQGFYGRYEQAKQIISQELNINLNE